MMKMFIFLRIIPVNKHILHNIYHNKNNIINI